MSPNDIHADLSHARAIEYAQQFNWPQAAWHETAAAHLTTRRRPELRGRRALQCSQWWIFAGRPQWGRQMAHAFSNDICIPMRTRQSLLKLARGEELEPEDHGMGIRFVGRGAGILNAMPWIFAGLMLYVAYKAGRYAITGSFGPPRVSTSLPPAWRVHG